MATDFQQAYNSFSGADIRAVALVPYPRENGTVEYKTEVLGTLQTLSYSIFREKHPVRALGTVAERGKTRGTRTIAGSLVFTIFDRHSFYNLLKHDLDATFYADVDGGLGERSQDWSAYRLADQLPRFDIVVSCANEYGHKARMTLYGIELMSEGSVFSIENLITEATFQFTASNISILRQDKGQTPQEMARTEQYRSAFGALAAYQEEKASVYRQTITSAR
jgi:hypothetical protein